MPRKVRLEYPGAIYQVMSRANGKGNIFETDEDRQDFLKTLTETCQKTVLRRESAEAKAGRLIGEELKRLGWKEGIWANGPRAIRPSWRWRPDCAGKRP